MNPRASQRRRGGFSLLELILALVILEVGLLGVAGMVLTAQRNFSRAQLVLRGTLEAREAGDSLLVSGTEGEGEVLLPWGILRWREEGEGGLDIAAVTRGGSDTLAILRIWPPPHGVEVVPGSIRSPGGREE